MVLPNFIKNITFVSFSVFLTSNACAHVKWFAEYDTKQSPVELSSVFSVPYFWLIFVLSVGFIFFMVWADTRTITLNRYIDVIRYKTLKRLPVDVSYQILTLTLIIFFTSIWAIGGIIMTPELAHSSYLIQTIQVFIIAALMTRKTAKYAGLCIFILWFYAIKHYGLFHLADYMIFLGIAIFMLIGHKPSQFKTSSISFVILYFLISWTLQWASVEKWIYPNWSYPLLEDRPHLAMNLPKETFMIIAGFVEFTLAFLLIALTGTGFIVTTLALAGIFLLAIVSFGKVDAIGHLGIIVCLYMMTLKGPCKLNYIFAKLHNNPIIRATKVTSIYFLSLAFFTTIYYALQLTT